MRQVTNSLRIIAALIALLPAVSVTAMPLPPYSAGDPAPSTLGVVQVGVFVTDMGIFRIGNSAEAFDPLASDGLVISDLLVPELIFGYTPPPSWPICSCITAVNVPVVLLPPLTSDPGTVALPSSLWLSGFGVGLLLLRGRRSRRSAA